MKDFVKLLTDEEIVIMFINQLKSDIFKCELDIQFIQRDLLVMTPDKQKMEMQMHQAKMREDAKLKSMNEYLKIATKRLEEIKEKNKQS